MTRTVSLAPQATALLRVLARHKWVVLLSAAAAAAGLVRHRQLVGNDHSAEDADMIVLWAPALMCPHTPHASPFVVKLDLMLRVAHQVAGIPFRYETPCRLQLSKHGKMPYIKYRGEVISDTRIIVEWLRERLGFDLDAGLTAEQRIVSHTAVRMLDESFYWYVIRGRWQDQQGFDTVINTEYFSQWPLDARVLMPRFGRNHILKQIHAQGVIRTGRLTDAELMILVNKDLDMLTALVAARPNGSTTVFGTPNATLLDTAILAHVGGVHFVSKYDNPVRRAIRARPALTTYLEDLYQRYYPDLLVAFLREEGRAEPPLDDAISAAEKNNMPSNSAPALAPSLE